MEQSSDAQTASIRAESLSAPAPAGPLLRGLAHPLFGDLGRPGSVRLGRFPALPIPVRERAFTTIHLTVTGRCFARCQGCINATVTACGDGESLRALSRYETNPERDARCIVKLAGASGGKEASVCFYGGEPLLAADAMERVARVIDAEAPALAMRYMVYTNGELLEQFAEQNPALAHRIFLYSVSVDGGEAQHDAIRLGTHLARIRRGLARLREERSGAVLMWSTLREGQSLGDCFGEFLRLHEEGLADQFFWHWVETSEPFADFSGYLDGYEQDLREIVGLYVRWLGRGRVLPVTHLNELVLYILTGKERGSSGCGVEVADNFDLIAGAIHSCADLPGDMAIGHIAEDGAPVFGDFDLSGLVDYKKRLGCRGCGVHAYCGGRCPVQAHISTPERLFQYCQLMRLHCAVVLEHMEAISRAMRARNITAQRLYDASAFFTQFTDVTP